MSLLAPPLAFLASCAAPAPATRVADVRSADVAYTASEPQILALRQTRSGQLLVHPTVDALDLGWFILDTGAGAMAIAPSAARRAQLQPIGEVRATGVAGSAMKTVYEGRTFSLGPVVLTRPQYVQVQELDGLLVRLALGSGIAGICGYDVFSAAIFELDAQAGRLTIHDPQAYPWPEGPVQELVLVNRLPAVRCRFEGDREGLFKLDTGSNSTVIFHVAAVRDLELLENRKSRAGFVVGVGGVASAPKGTLEWFELGGRRFEHLEVGFSKASDGATTPANETETLGTIGMKLLGEFRLVIDYNGRRIAFLPSQ